MFEKKRHNIMIKSNVRLNLEITISINKFSFNNKILLFNLCPKQRVTMWRNLPQAKWSYDLLKNFYVHFFHFFIPNYNKA